MDARSVRIHSVPGARNNLCSTNKSNGLCNVLGSCFVHRPNFAVQEVFYSGGNVFDIGGVVRITTPSGFSSRSMERKNAVGFSRRSITSTEVTRSNPGFKSAVKSRII